MLVIGLAGGMGVGKSAVAETLRELGASVIDADQEGHKAYERGSFGWHRITSLFGGQMLTDEGEIDRRKLGQLVFGSPQALAWLNAAIHPIIRDRIAAKLGELRALGCEVAVVDAAVLVEAGWDDLTDEVWAVTAPAEAAAERVAAQRGLQTWEALGRINAQNDLIEKTKKRADVVIENTGSIDDLRDQIERLWTEKNLPRRKQA